MTRRACKPTVEKEITKEITKEVSVPMIEKFQKILVQLPHATKVMVPKLEIDILNADKSNASEHNSLHFIVGGSIKFSVLFCSFYHL